MVFFQLFTSGEWRMVILMLYPYLGCQQQYKVKTKAAFVPCKQQTTDPYVYRNRIEPFLKHIICLLLPLSSPSPSSLCVYTIRLYFFLPLTVAHRVSLSYLKFYYIKSVTGEKKTGKKPRTKQNWSKKIESLPKVMNHYYGMVFHLATQWQIDWNSYWCIVFFSWLNEKIGFDLSIVFLELIIEKYLPLHRNKRSKKKFEMPYVITLMYFQCIYAVIYCCHATKEPNWWRFWIFFTQMNRELFLEYRTVKRSSIFSYLKASYFHVSHWKLHRQFYFTFFFSLLRYIISILFNFQETPMTYRTAPVLIHLAQFDLIG